MRKDYYGRKKAIYNHGVHRKSHWFAEQNHNCVHSPQNQHWKFERIKKEDLRKPRGERGFFGEEF